jgi:hypothetical protein
MRVARVHDIRALGAHKRLNDAYVSPRSRDSVFVLLLIQRAWRNARHQYSGRNRAGVSDQSRSAWSSKTRARHAAADPRREAYAIAW